MNETIKADVNSSVSLLKKAYSREKRARKETEDILEEKTLELFAANYELKAANETLLKQQRTLVKNEKLAALGELSAGIAHEINNPLAFVISNINSLEDYCCQFSEVTHAAQKVSDSGKCGSEAADNLYKVLDKQDFNYIINDSKLIFEEVKEGLDRVKDIVTNLKSFSRTQSSDRQDTDVKDCLLSALKIANNKLKYHCKVVQDFSPTPSIYCNKNELTQVFLNIIINAAQAIPTQGIITLATRCSEDYIIIDISDTGIGIPEEILDSIFNPFFTAKPLGVGTGLGLSVSYGIIKDLSGTISAESTPGAGTTFTILIPNDARMDDSNV
jgi:two-component system NtrC family sensor kinase|tara:strand:- start:2360 stop:3346 length:987 start_codon:yes stop_codon:yes gene_type:complete